MSTVLLYKVSLSTVCYGHITYKVDIAQVKILPTSAIHSQPCMHGMMCLFHVLGAVGTYVFTTLHVLIHNIKENCYMHRHL